MSKKEPMAVRKETEMIVGILLLYTGAKIGFQLMFTIGCWLVILISAVKKILLLIDHAYKVGKKDGKSRADKGV